MPLPSGPKNCAGVERTPGTPSATIKLKTCSDSERIMRLPSGDRSSDSVIQPARSPRRDDGLPSFLLVAKGNHRVQPGGPGGGEVAREKRTAGKARDGKKHAGEIVRLQVEEHEGGGASHHERKRHANRESERYQKSRLPQDQSEDPLSIRAQGHADADFATAPLHPIGDD